MFINYLSSVGLVLIVMSGISADVSPAQKPAVQKAALVPGNMWPFKKGNSWTMATTVSNSATKNKTVQTQVITVAEVKKTPDGDEASLEYSMNDKVFQIETYRSTSAGIFRTGGGLDGTSRVDPPLPTVKFPLKVGNTWNWKRSVTTPQGESVGTATYTAPEIRTLKLAGEEFRAYKVHLTMTLHQGDQKIDVVNDYWFAPDIGLVKQGVVMGTITVEGSVSKYKLVISK